MYNNNSITNKKSQVEMPPEWANIAEGVSSGIIKRVTYYKWINARVVNALEKIGETKKSISVDACGTWVEIAARDGRERITKANFCRERVCQICAWRRSMKFVAQMLPVLKELANDYKFIFLTFSMRNCESAEAGRAITALLNGWNKLYKRRAYVRAWKGFIRSVEVTYNTEKKSYHPHIHALIAVKKTYGMKKDVDYINVFDLVKDLRECMNLEYDPIVNIKRVRSLSAEGKKLDKIETTNRGALETMKYAFKVNYTAINEETISTFLGALKNRRLISFGGVVAKKRIEIRELQDIEFEKECAANAELATVLYKFSPSGWSIEEQSAPEDAGVYEVCELPHQYSLDENIIE